MPAIDDLSTELSGPLRTGRPLALVAEDNVTLREITVRMLDRRGVSAIPVGSFSQAATALSVSPHVDVALLDIHLNLDKDAFNKGGIDIARLLRSNAQRTHIIGYSGKFHEESLSVEEVDLFDSTMAKGFLRDEDFQALWEECAAYAREVQESRRDAANQRADELRRLYESEVPDVEVLRRLKMDDNNLEGFTAEGALGLAGYKIRVVQLRRDDATSRPVVIWQQEIVEDEIAWVNVEVYGQPSLYASADSEQASLSALSEFASLTYDDLTRPDGAASGSDRDARLLEFLRSLGVF